DAGCCRPAAGRKRKGSVFRFAPEKRAYLPILELLPPPTLRERRHLGPEGSQTALQSAQSGGSMVWMDCIFCHLNRSILAETKLSLACLDSFPVSKGHTLVIPKQHVVSLWEMTTEEYMDAFALIRQVKDVLQEQFHPQGFNVGVNCGQAAGQ